MNWLLLNSGQCVAAENMAVDEALLESISHIGQPVLRFYGWTQSAATFGYFQKYSEVERTTHLRPLIRRPTGGGIVPHDADWTYSVAFPPGSEWHSLKAEESYHRIHAWIQSAFTELKIETELAPSARKIENSNPDASVPSACFTGYEKSDLLWRGRKIAGAAQRRNKSGLLIQGSVQPPPVPLARPDWETAMSAVAQKYFGVLWQKFLPDEKFIALVETLAREKFSQDSFNRKR